MLFEAVFSGALTDCFSAHKCWVLEHCGSYSQSTQFLWTFRVLLGRAARASRHGPRGCLRAEPALLCDCAGTSMLGHPMGVRSGYRGNSGAFFANLPADGLRSKLVLARNNPAAIALLASRHIAVLQFAPCRRILSMRHAIRFGFASLGRAWGMCLWEPFVHQGAMWPATFALPRSCQRCSSIRPTS